MFPFPDRDKIQKFWEVLKHKYCWFELLNTRKIQIKGNIFPGFAQGFFPGI